MSEDELVSEYNERVLEIANESLLLGEKIPDSNIVRKAECPTFLRRQKKIFQKNFRDTLSDEDTDDNEEDNGMNAFTVHVTEIDSDDERITVVVSSQSSHLSIDDLAFVLSRGTLSIWPVNEISVMLDILKLFLLKLCSLDVVLKYIAGQYPEAVYVAVSVEVVHSDAILNTGYSVEK
ncbi:gag-pol polyprotein [Cucumis melo var. makuwa]|uniref:Gag-pol polyprotein n=1 Tax=Cucumis melo var. makuwa TaxID=1194695 RepID=A0A5A7UCE8_CUCMM|nr:gag-pol polyprotein [Cucumis melo var. makuwa]